MDERQREWVLKVEHLSLGFGTRMLVRNLSFEVAAGEILGIVGPNGCGKTTLLRALLGLQPPLEGRAHRRPGSRISYLPQRECIDRIIPITALEVVLMGLAARASALERVTGADLAAARRALALVDVEFLSRRLFRDLSGGQQQRVLLARALVTDPDVLVLDEPTMGMDVGGEAAMVNFLRDLNRRRGVTILIVTHLLPIVLNLASSIMLMASHGTLHGPVDDVLREDRLIALYGVPVRLGLVAGERTLVVRRQETVGV
jgi:ABC-type Mn2+/Zn2+ transport system ATPase subunit